jgi:hypothetical protein
MSSTTRQRLGALEEMMQGLVFRAHLRRARRAEDFTEALYAATLGADGRHTIDVALLEESELWLLAGGAAFEAWWQGLDVLEQMAVARGEHAPWRAPA